jgi:glutathione S-transferase
VKLYVFPVAPNPTRLRLYLAEKRAAGARFELEEITVDLRNMEQRSAAHLARNPLGKLPVLETSEGVFLTESLAIIEYLEELVPEPPMLGTTPIERACARELERIVELGVLRPIAEIVHATASPLGLPPNPAVAEHFRQSLPNALELLEERLSDGRPLLMGDRPSIADCSLAAAFQFGRVAKVEIDASFANLARWETAFRERPSAAQVLVL